MNDPIRLTVCSLLLAVSNLPAATLYVSLGSTNPTPPYATWATAATSIPNAVNAAAAGDEVVVNNGVYPGGLGVNGPLALRSVNGPQFTVIDGGGTESVRLSGQRREPVRVHPDQWRGPERRRGVVRIQKRLSHQLCDCRQLCRLLVGEDRDYGPLFAGGEGGGAYGGTLYNCTLTGNGAGQGGGAFGSTLYNCTLTNNWANVGTCNRATPAAVGRMAAP